MPSAFVVRFPRLVILLITVLPNLNTLSAGFVLDDLPLIVDNPKLHGISGLQAIWTSGYWPDRLGLTLYRPVTETLWLILWMVGNGRAIIFHFVNICLAAGVTLLVYELLLATAARWSPSAENQAFTAFAAAAIFALLPIHSEAVASVAGSAELLAALFGAGALLFFVRRRPGLALLFYAIAVFSKESAAAVAAIGWFVAPRPRSRHIGIGFGAVAIVGAALIARQLVASGQSFIPPIDNASALLPVWPRTLTALWVQVLYLVKTIAPITLSADYSYKEIPLVMSLTDMRASAGLLAAMLAVAALYTRPRSDAVRTKTSETLSIRLRRVLAASVIVWVVLFSPTANLLFPIGTIMAERLAFAPSVAVAFLLATIIDVIRMRAGIGVATVALLAILCIFGARTIERNRDWHDADRFYGSLVRAAPRSCKSHYFYGILLASKGDDSGAIREYDRAIAIFAGYSEAYQNRGNALARLGRYGEAMESYRLCLRFDPGHMGAARNLRTLENGLPLNPPRRRL
jgi:tetratricopeptide (TPR) repeat protein